MMGTLVEERHENGGRGVGRRGVAGGMRVTHAHEDVPPGPLELPVIHDPTADAAARYRVLAHRLRNGHESRNGHGPRNGHESRNGHGPLNVNESRNGHETTVLAVTSARAREGKTTCAINLAAALAERGEGPVLLADLCVRSPKLAESLGFAPETCATLQLARANGDGAHGWELTAVWRDELHVLAIAPGQETEVLAPRAIETLVGDARQSGYAYVVLDCPAALASPDVGLCDGLVDGLVLTARAGVTRKSALLRAAEAFDAAPVLAVVLMGARGKR